MDTQNMITDSLINRAPDTKHPYATYEDGDKLHPTLPPFRVKAAGDDPNRLSDPLGGVM